MLLYALHLCIYKPKIRALGPSVAGQTTGHGNCFVQGRAKSRYFGCLCQLFQCAVVRWTSRTVFFAHPMAERSAFLPATAAAATAAEGAERTKLKNEGKQVEGRSNPHERHHTRAQCGHDVDLRGAIEDILEDGKHDCRHYRRGNGHESIHKRYDCKWQGAEKDEGATAVRWARCVSWFARRTGGDGEGGEEDQDK